MEQRRDSATAYIILADGFETIEALTPLDVLRRCGVEVTTISLNKTRAVRSSHGVTVEADATMEEYMLKRSNAVSSSSAGSSTTASSTVRQALILPGGYPGYKNLCDSPEVGALITQFHKEGKLLCAICGAPTALKANQICRGAAITCHTSVKEELSDYYSILSSAVVKYMNIITGMGAGRSLEFAFAIAEALTSKEKVEEIKAKMEII